MEFRMNPEFWDYLCNQERQNKDRNGKIPCYIFAVLGILIILNL
jgi:hypothetical protein